MSCVFVGEGELVRRAGRLGFAVLQCNSKSIQVNFTKKIPDF